MSVLTRVLAAIFAIATLGIVYPVHAQDAEIAAEKIVEVELGDRTDALAAAIEAPEPAYAIDTAMVFTNVRRSDAIVRCVVFNDDGRVVGRFRVKVPADGIRIVSASQVRRPWPFRFIGQARCTSRRFIVPSLFVLGSGALSDGKARVEPRWENQAIIFPVIAAL